MKRICLLLMLCAPGLVPVAAHADPHPRAERRGHDEQIEVRRELREGNVMSLRDIVREILPSMPGSQYLGSDYDPEAMAYRLKFIREGRVLFVDVNARTGQVVGGNR